MKKGVVIGIAIAVFILLVGGYLLYLGTLKVVLNSDNLSPKTSSDQIRPLINAGLNPDIISNLVLTHLENETNRVIIKNFAFEPAQINIKSGEMVVWINEDSATHSVNGTIDGGYFYSGPFETNSVFGITFDAPGTYEYHCGIHASMKGTVVVS